MHSERPPTRGSRALVAFLAVSACVGCASMHAEVEIRAPAARVFGILGDVERYHEWNPFFTEGHGCVAEGDSLELTMAPVGQSPTKFSPRVLEVRPGERLVWRGRLLVAGLFDGTHTFVIRPVDSERVRVSQDESFSGILVPFVGLSPYRAGWEKMNEALKRRAEGSASSTDEPSRGH
jgi:hypothetical protein